MRPGSDRRGDAASALRKNLEIAVVFGLTSWNRGLWVANSAAGKANEAGRHG
jgi:hypothetical protein